MPGKRIVVVGSINMDLVVRCEHLPAPGETIIANDASEMPGGKGANQAVAAARAGGDVTMIGRVGDDAFAERLLQNLTNESIDVSAVEPTQDCASGIAVVAVESRGENSIMVIPGANGRVTPDDIQRNADTIRSADILLLQLEIPIESVIAAIGIAKLAGVKTILDPAPMPAEFPVDLFAVDVLCPNQNEASAITGLDCETVEQAQAAVAKLLQQGARSAIITLGGHGAVVGQIDQGEQRDRGEQRIEWISPFSVSPVDTTAAGDAFAGALAVRLAEGDTLFSAAKFASAAGAIAATRRGAQLAMPNRTEIQQLATQNNNSE